MFSSISTNSSLSSNASVSSSTSFFSAMRLAAPSSLSRYLKLLSFSRFEVSSSIVSFTGFIVVSMSCLILSSTFLRLSSGILLCISLSSSYPSRPPAYLFDSLDISCNAILSASLSSFLAPSLFCRDGYTSKLSKVLTENISKSCISSPSSRGMFEYMSRLFTMSLYIFLVSSFLFEYSSSILPMSIEYCINLGSSSFFFLPVAISGVGSICRAWSLVGGPTLLSFAGANDVTSSLSRTFLGLSTFKTEAQSMSSPRDVLFLQRLSLG